MQSLQLKYLGEEIPSEQPEVENAAEDADDIANIFADVDDDEEYDGDEPLFGEGSHLDDEDIFDEEFDGADDTIDSDLDFDDLDLEEVSEDDIDDEE